MRQLYRYLVIDDDSTSNLICDFTIQRFDKEAERSLFTSPEEALDHIRHQKLDAGLTVLFLDVNMPTMSGFEFLREFDKFDENIKNQYRIYMLTSSIEDYSSQAKKFSMVIGFLSKPMKITYLEEIRQDLKNCCS
ncbi:hypothetical protein C7S20_07405 [Christiangramia fulva]|uniref:Response regulatory domain-containing protein n=1 Tax=Christiangramia fulva TaxID=2126553 RepID=A0A2R3Z4B1_9FLAO|nr:response regulator [Christiangramia fulva]AVR45110.1 hypothetical protein C7S20_07405 [Christiangramia fulva]